VTWQQILLIYMTGGWLIGERTIMFHRKRHGSEIRVNTLVLFVVFWWVAIIVTIYFSVRRELR